LIPKIKPNFDFIFIKPKVVVLKSNLAKPSNYPTLKNTLAIMWCKPHLSKGSKRKPRKYLESWNNCHQKDKEPNSI
jgi:hypothetical protein